MSRATEYNLPFLTCSPLVSGVGSRAGGQVLAIKAGTVKGGFGFPQSSWVLFTLVALLTG
jgi:hypothetical protein